jgi:hypothetical protein
VNPLVVAGFAAWIGGAAWVVRRGLDPERRWAWRQAAPGLLAWAAGVAVWLLSIWRA